MSVPEAHPVEMTALARLIENHTAFARAIFVEVERIQAPARAAVAAAREFAAAIPTLRSPFDVR